MTEKHTPFFPNRKDTDYQKIISEHMELENLKLGERKTDSASNDEKVIKIELAGIAGTALLIKQKDKFIALLKAIPDLQQKGVTVTIRFLFTYLYSDFAHSQIEAEKAEHRSFIGEPWDYKHDKIRLDLLNQDTFQYSYTYRDQRDALEKIKKLYNTHCAGRIDFDSVFDIRFSCLPLNFCVFNINGTIFFDSYSYAKEKEERLMSHDMPVLVLSPAVEDEKKNIDVIRNHFWYIWHHSTTLLCRDATRFAIDNYNEIVDLQIIKEPENISYKNKRERVRKIAENSGRVIPDATLNSWQQTVEHSFRHMTREIPLPIKREKVFIGFAFRKVDEIDKLKDYLRNDFKNLDVEIVDLIRQGADLYSTLMTRLKRATMGLFFLTEDIQQAAKKDIPEKERSVFHARPNVYFELGYLLGRFAEEYGKSALKRIGIFIEENVEVPSDIGPIYRTIIPTDTPPIIYYFYVLDNLIHNYSVLDSTSAEKVVSDYCARLIEEIDDEKTAVTEVDLNIIIRHKSSQNGTSTPIDSVKNILMASIRKRFEEPDLKF